MLAPLAQHVIVIDGVLLGEDPETLRLQELRLTPEAPQQFQATIRMRMVGPCVRRGLLERASGEAMRRCEHGGGFSLDAGVRTEGNDRQGFEQLAAPTKPAPQLRCAGAELAASTGAHGTRGTAAAGRGRRLVRHRNCFKIFAMYGPQRAFYHQPHANGVDTTLPPLGPLAATNHEPPRLLSADGQ